MSSRGRGSYLKYITDNLKKNTLQENRNNSIPVENASNLKTTHGCGRAHLIDVIKGIDSNAICTKEELSTSNDMLKKPKQSKDGSTYMPKNKHGVTGEEVNLSCNYIRICSDPKKGVYLYEVTYYPKVDSVQLRMKYLNEHIDKIGGTKIFDGILMYLPILLDNPLTTFVSKSIDGGNIEVRILYKKQESIKNCTHLYNILFDRVMKTLNYVKFDNKQYNPEFSKIIPQHKLEVWPGYIMSVNEFDGGLMLCCDISHRLLSTKSVLEILKEIYHSNKNDHFEDTVKRCLLGSVVITRYNNKKYRIDDICFKKTPKDSFETRNGQTTYTDYYRLNYNIVIKDENQPLLISIKKEKPANGKERDNFIFCLVPELCFLTGLRDNMRSDHKLMRDIATYTCVTPNQRLLALQKFYTNIKNCENAYKLLNDWGITLSPLNEILTGRKFKEETIHFGNEKTSSGLSADFSYSATKNSMLKVVHLNNWILIHCRSDNQIANNFIDMMIKYTCQLGMQVAYPKVVILDSDRVDAYVDALRHHITRQIQLVVCICSTNRDDRYAAIKKVCCAENPIPSQVINSCTLSNSKKNRSIVQKIALQINCKLGGSLWGVHIPFKSKVMICGIDSYHDPSKINKSVSALVASLNTSSTRWFSKAQIQTNKDEFVSGLCSMFIAALFAFQKENGVLPENVIIYRDGIGDGQLSVCENFEISQFEEAFTDMFPQCDLKITFIIVQKRINTRFFLLQKNEPENPSPGTVLDHNITRRYMFDFFLVSQSVRQGTVSPTHYIVLRDDANYSPDIIQRLSYKLCFMYYNWPGSIRIPAPVQYAHKMAYLIGQSVRRPPADELSTRLFYL